MGRVRDPVTGRVLAALLALEVALTLVDLVLGPGTRLAPEEAWNLRAGLQLACGHGDALWALQYRSFCGGCSAEAVLAAPLFGVFGDALWSGSSCPPASTWPWWDSAPQWPTSPGTAWAPVPSRPGWWRPPPSTETSP